MKTSRSAFTLLEIMLAVTILGLLVIAVSSTWSAGLRGWKRSNTLAETWQRERILSESIAELAQAAVYFPDRRRLYAFRLEHDSVRGDSISFVTASDALLPPSEAMLAGLRRVTLYLDQDADGQPCLMIQNAPALQEEEVAAPKTGYALARGVTGFAVRLRDIRTEAWKEKWEETDTMPSGLEFRLTLAPLDGTGPEMTVTRLVDLPAAKLAQYLPAEITPPEGTP